MLNRKSRHSQEGPWYGIFFPLNISHNKKHKDEIIIRSVTTVSGGMFFNAVFVAINEAAQKNKLQPGPALQAAVLFVVELLYPFTYTIKMHEGISDAFIKPNHIL
jgi:hypothetical protein